MVAVVDTILASVLWCLFGHYSQTFDWLAFYVWLKNDCKLDKPLVRALVLMPLFRFLGDIVNRALGDWVTDGNAAASIPSPLWYLGEIYGDSYLPMKALAMLGSGQKGYRAAVWFGFACFALPKVGSIVFRLYAYANKFDTASFFYGVSTIDSIVCFTGALSDLIVCFVMYRRSEELMEFRSSNLLQIIKQSSLARVLLMFGLKILNGAFFVAHPCGAFETVCQYGFLRGVITTVDYQLYYLDYFLSKGTSESGTSASSKLKNSNQIPPKYQEKGSFSLQNNNNVGSELRSTN
jgi:hypothetical protein